MNEIEDTKVLDIKDEVKKICDEMPSDIQNSKNDKLIFRYVYIMLGLRNDNMNFDKKIDDINEYVSSFFKKHEKNSPKQTPRESNRLSEGLAVFAITSAAKDIEFISNKEDDKDNNYLLVRMKESKESIEKEIYKVDPDTKDENDFSEGERLLLGMSPKGFGDEFPNTDAIKHLRTVTMDNYNNEMMEKISDSGSNYTNMKEDAITEWYNSEVSTIDSSEIIEMDKYIYDCIVRDATIKGEDLEKAEKLKVLDKTPDYQYTDEIIKKLANDINNSENLDGKVETILNSVRKMNQIKMLPYINKAAIMFLLFNKMIRGQEENIIAERFMIKGKLLLGIRVDSKEEAIHYVLRDNSEEKEDSRLEMIDFDKYNDKELKEIFVEEGQNEELFEKIRSKIRTTDDIGEKSEIVFNSLEDIEILKYLTEEEKLRLYHIILMEELERENQKVIVKKQKMFNLKLNKYENAIVIAGISGDEISNLFVFGINEKKETVDNKKIKNINLTRINNDKLRADYRGDANKSKSKNRSNQASKGQNGIGHDRPTSRGSRESR